MSIKDSLTCDVIKLLFNFGYHQVGPIAKGGFGTVLSAKSPDGQIVAIKMIKMDKCWDIEEKVWPILHHENILPLLEKIDVKELDVKLFVMPMHPHVLHRVLASESFLADKTGLLRVKRWLVDVLKGLQYLHSLGYAHLDLKNDNVLVAADDRAVLCDYSGLNFTNVPLKRLCAPKVFRPPEFYDEILRNNLEGTKCDVWLFGLMTLKILTGNGPSSKMGRVTDDASWKLNVETVLKEALKANNFCRLMKASFPSVNIPTEELLLAHDFVSSILQWDRSLRPSVQQIQGHPFLTYWEFGDSIYISNPEDVKIALTSHLDENWTDPNTAEQISGEKATEPNEKEHVYSLDKGDRQPLNDENEVREKEKTNPPEKGMSNQVSDPNLELTEVGKTDAVHAESKKQKKNLGTRILHWVTKKYNRIFMKKK